VKRQPTVSHLLAELKGVLHVELNEENHSEQRWLWFSTLPQCINHLLDDVGADAEKITII
jgi:DNA primase large subunit